MITGARRAFCTGVDLKALAADRFHLEDFIAWEDAMTAMERMDALFIAAINGHCLGGGLSLRSSATTDWPTPTHDSACPR